MCLSKREREFINDWLSYMDGEITLSEFVARWKSEGDDWKVYMRVMRHRINKKYRRMLNDLILMKKFLELEYHP
ncbi:hypothetical protein [Geoglobus acetivorans]|uniref:Uncharacterized protein n=1 Tax=Geoglobus acetivorans TaxID=565033 RepID=A0ABZ3H6T5_GEOAI|nr:hypothetical protein [Geoglobus acetivorans]